MLTDRLFAVCDTAPELCKPAEEPISCFTSRATHFTLCVTVISRSTPSDVPLITCRHLPGDTSLVLYDFRPSLLSQTVHTLDSPSALFKLNSYPGTQTPLSLLPTSLPPLMSPICTSDTTAFAPIPAWHYPIPHANSHPDLPTLHSATHTTRTHFTHRLSFPSCLFHLKLHSSSAPSSRAPTRSYPNRPVATDT